MSTPAVAYYRMSSDRQERSIPAQRSEVEAYAATHGYRIVREYLDEGISGDATEKRIQFRRMLEDAGKAADFGVVLCWDQDRFGRFDPLEAGYWIKPLRDAGVRLETVAQGVIDWEDFAGQIVYAVNQAGKHAFLRDLSRNTLRGKLRRALEGSWPGGAPPFGYNLGNHRLVLGDERRVRFVRWLFRTYAGQGSSLRSIVETANEGDVKPARGERWGSTSVHKILCCPLYTGDFVWNRLHRGKYHGIRNGALHKVAKQQTEVVANASGDFIMIPDNHKAIIDRSTWEAAQQKLAANKHATRPNADAQFFLTGLIYCGNCGSRMHGATDKRRKAGDYRTQYVCSGYHRHGRGVCERFRVPEMPLVHCIIRLIQKQFLNPANLRKLEAEMTRQLNGTGQGDRMDMKKLRGRLAKLNQQIDAGAERLLAAPTELVPILTQKLQSWQKERDQLQRQLSGETGRTTKANGQATVKKALSYLWTLEKQLQNASPLEWRDVIREMVSKVECWYEHAKKGNRTVRRLCRGVIHLRPQIASGLSITSL